MTTKRKLMLAIIAVLGIAVIAAACGGDDDDNGGDGDGNGGAATTSSTLADVIARDSLKCGVKETQRGFGFLAADGTYSGIDVEFCKAVAAAVLGDPDKVEFVLASAGDRFELLSAKQIDVLIRTTTWTSGRDIGLESQFAQITFYDGQGMMVKADSAFQTLADLDGATICVTGGTTTEGNLEDRFAAAGLSYTPLTFEGDPEIVTAFGEGRCDAWTADKGNLAGQRFDFPEEAGGPDSLRILPLTMSKEPLGPVVRDGDTEWFDVINWVVLGTIAAEELGVNQGNVAAEAANPSNIDIARLLGGDGDFGSSLGLDNDFMVDVLTAVGNYGEIYERTLAQVGLERAGSLNDLWTRGGAMYAPPIR